MPLAIQLLLPLAQNISLFVLFVTAFSMWRKQLKWPSPLAMQLTAGLVFGVSAVLAMASPFQLSDGFFIDGRGVVIAVGTVIAGPVAGAVCTVIAAAYRWHVGGLGVVPALPGMLMTFSLAAAYRWFLQSGRRSTTAGGLGLLGIIVAAANLATFLVLPDSVVSPRMIEVVAVPLLVLTPAGTYVAAVLILWMEQREELRTQLVAANQRLELALKGSQDGVFDYDPQTRRMWTSDRYREMCGYGGRPADMDLEFWRGLVLAEDRLEMERQFADLEAGIVDRIDLIMRTIHQTGRVLHIRSRVVSQKDKSGNIWRIVGSSSDETRRVEAETRLRDAIESMDSGFAYFDAQDRLVICNDAYIDPGTRERFGNPVGRTFDQIMRSFSSGEFTATDALRDRESWLRWRTEQHRNPPERPLEIQWTDGRWFSVLERRTSDGGSVGIWTDITEQKLREFEIEFAKEQLEGQAAELATLFEDIHIAREDAETAKAAAQRANLEKSRFLASMSHELRTPLNAIIGFSDVMRGEMFGAINPPQYGEYAKLISDSGQHLLSLINDVLDLSKVEAGRMTLSIETLSSQEVCHQAIGLTREMASQKGVELKGQVQTGLTMLHGDQRAVKQILLNLLSNAIKFTEGDGCVDLEISATPEGAIFKVTDTGIGMTSSEMKTALEPYGQINSPLARKSQGTGLGLPLAKSLAELHGGSLLLTSEKGVGTSITVMLPWKENLCIDAAMCLETAAAEQ